MPKRVSKLKSRKSKAEDPQIDTIQKTHEDSVAAFPEVSSSSSPETQKVHGIFMWKRQTIYIGAIVLLAGTSLYFFYQYRKLSTQTQTPVAVGATPQVAQLVSKVGNLMMLPNETPTIATVSDITKLSGQPFFTNAQNGDEVLIYSGAKEAILYRPSVNKIITVAPLNLPPTQSADANPTPSAEVAGASTSATFTVVLANGTKTIGLTKTAEKDLLAKFPNMKVADKINAKYATYSGTLVIDLSGTHAEDAQNLAQSLQGTVSSLPAGETKPDADIFVILGKDFVK